MFSDSNVIFQFRGPFGVPVQIGSSILFLVLIFVSFTGDPIELYYDIIFLALILGSIFLHELGHAWGCLIQNVPVRRIMIYGGGGFCEHSRSTSTREDELIVAMGPIVNLTLWALASLVAPNLPPGDLAWVVESLAWINIFLAIFNMIPVMPLDGGKLFQLLLLRLLPSRLATQISGGIGLVIAVLWIPMMLLCYVELGFVLLFLPPIGQHLQMLRQRG